MKHPMPTVVQLRKAREEFKRIEAARFLLLVSYQTYRCGPREGREPPI